MAKRRKAGVLFYVAGAALMGAIVVGAVTSGGGSSKKVADPGGGPLAPPTAPPAPYAISTLAPVGTAAQDPGGGGGGTGEPGNVGPPAVQGAQGSGRSQGRGDPADILYFNGVSTLDPTLSAITSGEVEIGGPPLDTLPGDDSSTGCARPPRETDYYAIPLRSPETFSGNPQVHLVISGGGTVTVTLFQELNGEDCQALGSGTAPIRGGVSDVTLGIRGHTFPVGANPTLVIRVNDEEVHTLRTSQQNPSYLFLPGADI